MDPAPGERHSPNLGGPPSHPFFSVGAGLALPCGHQLHPQAVSLSLHLWTPPGPMARVWQPEPTLAHRRIEVAGSVLSRGKER